MPKKRGFVNVVIGILLILISVYPIFLIIRERAIETYISSNYDFEQVIDIKNQFGKLSEPVYDLSKPILWKENTIEVIPNDTGKLAPKTIFDKFEKESKHISNIMIRINGKDVASPTEAWLSPNITKDSDYLSWLNIVKIKDRKSNHEKVAIIRRNAEHWSRGDTQNQNWTIVYLEADKQLTEEKFSYIDRGKHPLGVKLVQISSQSSSPIGYKSDISYLMPSLIFPLIYPTGTCIIGIILLIIGVLRYRSQ